MTRVVIVAMIGGLLGSVSAATAQTWTGVYAGGTVGAGFPTGADEVVRFDTDLDGDFAETVRTGAGADAFSPGFCGGTAMNALAASGCLDDEAAAAFGGRVGYDWHAGRFVGGGVVEVGRPGAVDVVTAFSTTPAFYTFRREAKAVTGLRARLGVASDRALVYGTGGPAAILVEHTFTSSNLVNTFTGARDGESTTVWGYQAGAGLEFRVGGGWSVVGEYLFTRADDRDESTIRAQGPAPATNPFILVNRDGTDLQRANAFRIHSALFGLHYRFGVR